VFKDLHDWPVLARGFFYSHPSLILVLSNPDLD